jgi:hypothetical protein
VWAINDQVLLALEQSQVWEESGLTNAFGFTPQKIYGPNGKLPQYWGRTWDTGEAMHGALRFNMGGGVPVEIIRELVSLSENQAPGLEVKID